MVIAGFAARLEGEQRHLQVRNSSFMALSCPHHVSLNISPSFSHIRENLLAQIEYEYLPCCLHDLFPAQGSHVAVSAHQFSGNGAKLGSSGGKGFDLGQVQILNFGLPRKVSKPLPLRRSKST